MTFNANGLMTILAGAFSGLQQEIRNVSRQDGEMGFGRSENPTRASVYLNEALISYGMIPELVNRITGFCILKDLTVESLEQILMAKHGVLASYNEMLKPQGLEVDLEPNAISGATLPGAAEGATAVDNSVVGAAGAAGGRRSEQSEAIRLFPVLS